MCNDMVIYPEEAFRDFRGEELKKVSQNWLDRLGNEYKKAEESEGLVMRINSFLNMKPVKWSEVMEVIVGEQFSRLTQLSSFYANAIKILKISKQEEELGLTLSCEGRKSLEDLERLYTEIVFLLRRVELGYGEEGLCSVIEDGIISFVCIGQIIYSGKIREKTRVCLRVADIYMKHGKRKEAIYLLFFMADFLKEEEVIFEFCCFLLERKEIGHGNEMLRKISNQTPKVKEMQTILEGKLRKQ